ncbi:MAG: TolB family protein [Gemmatimonadaceae bacterium]
MRLVTGRVLAVALLGASPVRAQAVPSTDIYLASLSMHNGRPVVGTPVNVTHRTGYDNQPSFTPDSRAILFTSIHEDGQSDIYRIDVATKAIAHVTSTPESEYSATVMPGGKRFSVIRVERDSAQRLWSFALDGQDPRVVLEGIKPVGYHAWIDANNLALFVLGSPNALVHADVRAQKYDTLARRVGRSLAPLPDGGGFSFVRQADSTSTLVAATWPGFATHDLVALPRGSQDVAWVSPTTVLTGSGSRLLMWTKSATGWTEIADFAAAGLTTISRLAVSPDGHWLAIVATPKA